jgi:DNA-binding transcriptional ArsR family regulator
MSLLPSRPDAEPAEDAGPRVIGVDDDAADDVLSALSSGTARSLLSALHDDPAPPSELAESCDTSLQNVQYHLGKLENAGAVEVVDTAYSEKGREMDVYAPADQPLVVFAGQEDDGSTLRTALTRLLGAVGILALGSLLVQSLAGEIPIGAPGAGGGASSAPPDGDDGGDGGDGGGDSLDAGDGGGDAGGGGGGDGGVEVQVEETATETATPAETDTPMETATQTAADGGATATQEPEATQTVAETTAEATQAATETPMATEAPETVQQTATEVSRTSADVATTAATETARQAPEAAGGLPPGLLFFAGGLFVLAVIAGLWYVTAR